MRAGNDDQPTTEDLAEIARLTERARGLDRRAFIASTGRVLAYAIPAVLTFSIPRKALGDSGSGSSSSSSSPPPPPRPPRAR